MPPRAHLDVVVAQTAPALGDREANRINAAAMLAEHPAADVVVFPELSLTGYAMGHRARELGMTLEAGLPFPLDLGRGHAVAVVGMVERGEDHLTYNSTVAVREGTILAVQRKRYLPTYGTFDEGRLFAPGRRSPRPFTIAEGWSAGLLVCEDFWHPSLSYLHAIQGMDVLIVQAAAPGRGLPPDTGDVERRFASTSAWEIIARATALIHGIHVVLCNRVGIEGGITFAGGSMVVGPDGEILARAKEGEPDTTSVRLHRAAVARARQPFSHLRDEDPAVTLHTLERILSQR
ncbi:MAG: carbon-nitrogen hydrolase [Gemmatimonadota bacterium]|nr:carbon-nitrogen hydrolase [Gemmatimonadota bacterium]